MFSRQLLNSDPSKIAKIPDPSAPNYRMADYGYAKEMVRVFQVKKEGPYHTIIEYNVEAHLRLRTHKEYYNGVNSDIIGSDVVESNVYMHAQKYGLTTPEEFALTLSEALLQRYELATDANINVEDVSWRRLGEPDYPGNYTNAAHNHAFIRNSPCVRYCEVVRRKLPDNTTSVLLMGGLKGLGLVKTTCAPFVGYLKDAGLYVEGDMPDRVLRITVNAKWQYAQTGHIDFNTHWQRVRDIIVRSFAGDPKKGIIITSVQYFAYTAGRAIMDAMPEICSTSVKAPNYVTLPYDFSSFPPISPKANVTIINPTYIPYSECYAQVDRLKSTQESTKNEQQHKL